jgi:hypothetical protein
VDLFAVTTDAKDSSCNNIHFTKNGNMVLMKEGERILITGGKHEGEIATIVKVNNKRHTAEVDGIGIGRVPWAFCSHLQEVQAAVVIMPGEDNKEERGHGD